MTPVVLTQRADSGYDDATGEWYHFPDRYLGLAKAAVGSGCLYYEPRRPAGRLVYWASGTIVEIEEDRNRSDHYYARIEDFLPFPTPVSFRRSDGTYWETALNRGDGQPSKGAMGWSIRRIPIGEFDLILRAGYAPVLSEHERPEPRSSAAGAPPYLGMQEEQLEYERPILERLTSRAFRDRVFSMSVREAYGSRCAITGLKIINGGGRPEIEAAHIRPVEHKGPDSVRNGIGLSRTAHWMFDRGLISIDDDFRLLPAKHLPDGVERLFDPSGYVKVPEEDRMRPNPAFLRWHRENCFKG